MMANMFDRLSEGGRKILNDEGISVHHLKMMSPKMFSSMKLPLGDILTLQQTFPNLREIEEGGGSVSSKMKMDSKLVESVKNKMKNQLSATNQLKKARKSLEGSDSGFTIRFRRLYKKKGGRYEELGENEDGGERCLTFTGDEKMDDILTRTTRAYYDEYDSSLGKSYDMYHVIFVNGRLLPDRERLEDYLIRKGFVNVPTFYFASAVDIDEVEIFDFDMKEQDNSKEVGKGRRRCKSSLGRTSTSAVGTSTSTPTGTLNALRGTTPMVTSSLTRSSGESRVENNMQDRPTAGNSRSERYFRVFKNNVFESANKKIWEGTLEAYFNLHNIRLINEKNETEKAVGSGVTKEFSFLYFKTLNLSGHIAEGVGVKIPAINDECHENCNANFCKHYFPWYCVGKMSQMSWDNFKYFPVQIAKSILYYVLYDKIDKQLLLEDFLLFLDEKEENKLNRIRSTLGVNVGVKFSLKDHEISLNLNTEDELNGFLEEIAEEFLITRRLKPISLLRKEFRRINIEETEFHKKYQKSVPNTANLLDKLIVNDDILRPFIDQFFIDYPNVVEKFIRCTTGLNILTTQNIYVNNEAPEQNKNFVFSACTNTVSILVKFETYESFEESFKAAILDEFNTI